MSGIHNHSARDKSPRRFFYQRGASSVLAFLLSAAALSCPLKLAFSQTQVQVPAASTLPNPARIPLTGPIHFQAKAVSFHVMDGVHFNVRQVDALLLPAHPNQPVVIDNPESIKVRLLNANTTISAQAMTRLLNGYTLPQARVPVHDVNLTFEDGEVHLTGKLHKIIDLPFTAQASLSVNSNGILRLHFNKITAAGIFHKGLLDMLGLNVADLAKPGVDHSIRVEKDDVYFPLHALFPAPHFSGHLKSATIVGEELVEIYGDPKPFAPAPMPAEHYIYFRGGIMQFGRLTMQGVDLELLNQSADESFELSLRDLFRQSLPGYLKNMPDRGLVAYVQSFQDADARRDKDTAPVADEKKAAQ